MNHYVNLKRKFQIGKQVNVLVAYAKFTYNTWVSSDGATKYYMYEILTTFMWMG